MPISAWLAEGGVRNWLREMTSEVLRGLLKIYDAETDPTSFQEHFDALLDWSWRYPDKLKDELRKSSDLIFENFKIFKRIFKIEFFTRDQGVTHLSLFDVIIDWCIMDAVDFQVKYRCSVAPI